MKPRFLIFPCLLTDEQFQIIQSVKESLAKCHYELTVLCSLNPEVRYLKIDCIVTDLSEILKNRIDKGWRYNSYVLNLAVVKLDYVITIVNLDLCPECKVLHTELLHSLEVLSQILSDSYIDYIKDEF